MQEKPHTAQHHLRGMDADENSRQFIHHAIELALSLGDFQKEVNCQSSPRTVARKAIERIERLIQFESSAIYLVDDETSDLKLAVHAPTDSPSIIEKEVDTLIENGSVAWAIRERRGIPLYSGSGNRQLFLHVLATCSRIRGLFIGIFPEKMTRLPDTALEILSIILRNAANCIESLNYSGMLKRQKKELEVEIEEKTNRLVVCEKQILQAQNMEAIAKLAGGVAHQFNNALTSLIGYLDLTAMSVDSASKTAGYIERIRPVAERMCFLTNNLLAYAQGGNFITRILTLKEIFQDVLPPIQRSLKPSVTFSHELVDESTTLQVDLIQLRMVLLAVVENANEAIAGEGHITLSTKVLDSTELADEAHAGRYLCLTIRDNGRGMDEETRRRIFEPFFSTKFEGRGLSMAAVFGIIKNHKGWIEVESRLTKGTQVDIFLPVAAD